VMEGAVAAGLAFDAAALARLAAGRDCRGPLGGARPGLIGTLLGWKRADRDGPAAVAELSEAAAQRWRDDPGYRPRALDRVAAALGGEARAAPQGAGGSIAWNFFDSPERMIR